MPFRDAIALQESPLLAKSNLLQFGTIPGCVGVGVETPFPVVVVVVLVLSVVLVPTTPTHT